MVRQNVLPLQGEMCDHNPLFPECSIPERCLAVYDEDFGEDMVVWNKPKSW